MREQIPNPSLNRNFDGIDTSLFEGVEEYTYSIIKNDEGEWVVFHEKGGQIPIDGQLARSIRFAMRVQERVAEKESRGETTPLQERYALINCRKAAWLARHPEDLRRMTDKTHIDALKTNSLEDINRISGVPELQREVDAMLQIGCEPLVGTSDDLHIHEYLDKHASELPLIVHMFNVEMDYADELIMRIMSNGDVGDFINNRMHRDHTFIVLGKDQSGRYACFHKKGPDIRDPFEIIDLESVLAFARIGHDDRIFVSMIGPFDSIERSEDNER